MPGVTRSNPCMASAHAAHDSVSRVGFCLRLMLALVTVLTATSCSVSEPRQPLDIVDPTWVSGEAAARLDQSGRFPVDRSVEAMNAAQISFETAVAQARAWLTTFGPTRMAALSEERGEFIDPGVLSPCERSYYARRTYEEQSTDHPRAVRRPFSPYWLVGLCDRDGRTVILLAVSALNDDVAVVDGQIRLPTGMTGAEFKSFGVPKGFNHIPISPEAAVAIAYAVTGRRVVTVPTLHMPPYGIFTANARWRLELESPVRVKIADGTSLLTDELWVGYGSALLEADIAAPVAPLEPWMVSYPTFDAAGNPAARVEVTFYPRTGRMTWEGIVAAEK